MGKGMILKMKPTKNLGSVDGVLVFLRESWMLGACQEIRFNSNNPYVIIRIEGEGQYIIA